MNPVTPTDTQGSSTRPYLIRALHDWCTDNGFTPYLAVHVDAGVQVPMEYVKNNEIVLNVGFEATSGLKLGNEFVEFKARFGGVAREIVVPVDHVVAIYARENGQGMAFPMPTLSSDSQPAAPKATGADRAPVRGLRLASADDAAPAAGETVRPDDAPASAGDDTPASEPDPETPSPAPTRPALKRIK